MLCSRTPHFAFRVADGVVLTIGKAVISEFDSRVERSVIGIRFRHQNFVLEEEVDKKLVIGIAGYVLIG